MTQDITLKESNMPVSFERWQQVAEEFLNEIIRTNNIPANKVHPFWNFYHTEFKPGYYDSMPCTCSGKEWSKLVEQVINQYQIVQKENELRLYAEAAAKEVKSRGEG
jgi:hypothetical protein